MPDTVQYVGGTENATQRRHDWPINCAELPVGFSADLACSGALRPQAIFRIGFSELCVGICELMKTQSVESETVQEPNIPIEISEPRAFCDDELRRMVVDSIGQSAN
jgi:hypothetical protein